MRKSLSLISDNESREQSSLRGRFITRPPNARRGSEAGQSPSGRALWGWLGAHSLSLLVKSRQQVP